jgi:hypothetical protein
LNNHPLKTNCYIQISKHEGASKRITMADSMSKASYKRIKSLLAEVDSALQLNASPPHGLDNEKGKRVAPLSSDESAAHSKDLVKDITKEANRVCLQNSRLKKTLNQAEADLRQAKIQLAVKEDALDEMRTEYPVMRKLLERTWGILNSERTYTPIPSDMSTAYDALMAPEKIESLLLAQKRDERKGEKVSPHEQIGEQITD